MLDGEAARALAAGTPPLDATTEEHLEQVVFDALCGLGGFQPYLDDPLIENVNANGCDQVFVRYADGRREQVAPVAASDGELEDLVRAVAARAGIEERRFDRGCPRLSVPLPDGGRLFAVMAVTARPCVAIRRDRLAEATLADLAGNGTMSGEVAAFLQAAVRARKNILISGGTAAGKTTLLRALASAISPAERLITIEDSLELCLDRDAGRSPGCGGVAGPGAERGRPGGSEPGRAGAVGAADVAGPGDRRGGPRPRGRADAQRDVAG